MTKFTAKTPKSEASRRFFDFFIRVCIIFSSTAVVMIMAISMANDRLSLFKPYRSADISATDTDELAQKLYDAEIIDYPWLFSIYVKLNGGGEFNLNESVRVSSDMDYGQILAVFNKNDKSSVKRITFPSGATTDEIIDIFVENGMGTWKGFVEVINSYPFEYEFVSNLSTSEGRKYRLDGYLYPDTYDFYTGRSEAYYIYKLLDRFDSILGELDVDVNNIDEIVTIASMIQSSASRVGQYEYMSAVFHNRLNDPSTYPYLNCPASSAYGMGMGGVYIGVPDEEIKNFDSPYNTFLNEGLPPGAICNPDKSALICATRPANVKYKYFVTTENGDVLFASNETGHRQNLAKVNG